MRARLFKKKIEKEKLKVEERDQERIKRLKRQIGAAILNYIRTARQRAEEAKPVT
jgi:hypothetical protein